MPEREVRSSKLARACLPGEKLGVAQPGETPNEARQAKDVRREADAVKEVRVRNPRPVGVDVYWYEAELNGLRDMVRRAAEAARAQAEARLSHHVAPAVAVKVGAFMTE